MFAETAPSAITNAHETTVRITAVEDWGRRTEVSESTVTRGHYRMTLTNREVVVMSQSAPTSVWDEVADVVVSGGSAISVEARR